MSALERVVVEDRHRLRVTEILEPVYRQLDQWKKLIAISEARLSLIDDPVEASRLLSEIAQLHEMRGGDLARAFEAHARAFAREPDDDEVRGHVDRLAARQGAWEAHVRAYETALASAQDDGLRAQLLTTIARVHDEKRGDPRAAIAAYERLLAVEPDEPSTLDALEALHTMVGDWRGLVAVLERKVAAAFAAEERAYVLRRIGSVLEELLGDREGAIAAYKRALEEVDDDEGALYALDLLYTSGRQLHELASVLGRRIELERDPGVRVELGLRLAALSAEQLHQPERAIEAYRRVLEDDAQNAEAIERLLGLYERQGAWADLLDHTRLAIAVAAEPAARVALLCKAGSVLERELNDVPEAMEMYRQALELDPGCEQATAALMALTASDEHRAQASEIIEPLLREQGRWDDLVKLVERKVAALLDPSERRIELVRLAEIHEHGRQRAGEAFEALSRALAEEPADTAVQDELERLARGLDAWSQLYVTLMQRAEQVADAVDASQLFRRAGRIAESELHEDERAIEAFVQASQRDDDAPETLVSLDRLYEKTGRYEQLADVLERRIAALTAPAERAELLVRLGDVRAQRCQDGRGAFVSYQEVLEGDPAHVGALEGMEALGQSNELAAEVLEVLERCYRETNALDRVANLYDIKIRLAPTDVEKLALLREAAMLYEHDLGDAKRALGCVRRAFELDFRDANLLDDLERLASAAGAWPEIVGLVEGLLEAGVLEGSVKREIAERFAGFYREQLADPAREEQCLRAVLSVEPQALHVHERLVFLLRARGDGAALAQALSAHAEVEPDLQLRRAYLQEAGTLAFERGDLAAASRCYEGVLEIDGENASALASLAEIRAAEGRHGERVQLLLRLLAASHDPAEKRQLRHQVAEAQAERLGEPAQAVATYQHLLAEAPDDEAAALRLESLLESLGRHADLDRALRVRLERTSDLEPRLALHLRLARLAREQLDRPDLASGELQAILQQSPDHAEAESELERLYAATGQNDELATFLEARVQRASELGDREAMRGKLWALAQLQEQTLGQPERAIPALLRLRELDPSDVRPLLELERLYLAGGRHADVARCLEQRMALETPTQAIATSHSLAELAEKKLEDFGLAERALRHALGLDRANAQTRARLEALLQASRSYQALAELLTESLELVSEPEEQVPLLRRIASLYAQELSDPARAAIYFERVVALAPDDRAGLLALCDLYIAAGRQADAIAALEKLIASYGGRRAKEVAQYEHRLGQAYESIGNADEALKHYDAAFKIDLTSVPVLRDLGRLCLERGDLDRAQKTYRALLLQKLGPEVGIQKADVYYRLGEISLKQNDKVKAKSMLERAITEAGQHEAAKALLEQL